MSGTEDYLDGLLNSISEKDLDTKKKTGSETMQTEEDIMNDMENDLLSKEAEDNFLEQFEKELQNEKSSPEEEKTDDFFNSLDQIVDGADHNNNDDDFLMDTLGDIPGIDDVTKTEGLSQAQTMEKEPDEQSEDTAEPAQASDDAGSDTFGMDDAGSTGLDDFGDLGGADMFGDSEAEETEITPDGIEETPKKEGFLKKLSRILFGEDDEDEKGDSVSSQKEPLTGENAGDIDLSDPNMQILQELGDKKPKPPKEPDLTPPLLKVPVILIFVMVFSFLILVVLATNLVGYSSSFSNAEDAYAKGDYEQAFQDVAGLEVKEKDQDTYRKYRILAYTTGQYRAYQNLVNQKIYDMALDSLISTIGRCEEYSSDAKELGCEGEISDIQAKAEEALEAFKIDTEKALEVYDMKDRTAYSKEIYQILDDAGLSEE